MTYPVRLDGELTVDLLSLYKWWRENPEYDGCRPHTDKLLTTVVFQHKLAAKIYDHIQDLQKKYIATLIASVEAHVEKAYTRTSAHVRLASKLYPLKDVPKQLIQQNLSETIITHPVILDKKMVVDLTELKEWWDQYPEHTGRNFYTGKLIEYVEYHHQLKTDIERFVSDPFLYCKLMTIQSCGFLTRKATDIGVLSTSPYFNKLRNTPLLSAGMMPLIFFGMKKDLFLNSNHEEVQNSESSKLSHS